PAPELYYLQACLGRSRLADAAQRAQRADGLLRGLRGTDPGGDPEAAERRSTAGPRDQHAAVVAGVLPSEMPMMADLRLLPLGVGNAFSELYYSTSLAVIAADGRWLLVDCPHPIRKILREASLASGIDLGLEKLVGLAL